MNVHLALRTHDGDDTPVFVVGSLLFVPKAGRINTSWGDRVHVSVSRWLFLSVCGRRVMVILIHVLTMTPESSAMSRNWRHSQRLRTYMTFVLLLSWLFFEASSCSRFICCRGFKTWLKFCGGLPPESGCSSDAVDKHLVLASTLFPQWSTSHYFMR